MVALDSVKSDKDLSDTTERRGIIKMKHTERIGESDEEENKEFEERFNM